MGHPICMSIGCVFDENMDTNNTPDDMNEPQDLSGESAPHGEPFVDEVDVDGDALLEESQRLDETPEMDDAARETTQSFSNEDESIDGEIADGGGSSPPPPFQQQVPVEDRLVRDPNAALGGVLSGIAHRYGWDVSFTRLAFLFLVITTGVPFFAYFVAWLVIPRATMWPPLGPGGRPAGASRLSSRDLGIGLFGLAVLVAIAIGSGDAAAIIVPVALIAVGIWLLTQSPREQLATVGAGAAVSEPVYGVPLGAPTVPPATSTTSPRVAQSPVEPRNRGRRALKFALFGLLFLFLLAVLAIPLVALGFIFGGEVDFDVTSRRVIVENEIPADINQDVGQLIVDFSSFEFSEGAASSEMLDVELDVGSVTVIIPDDVRVEIDAESDLGEVTVFGQNEDGVNTFVTVEDDDPQLVLDIQVDVGEINVLRSSDFDTTTIGDIDIQERT